MIKSLFRGRQRGLCLSSDCGQNNFNMQTRKHNNYLWIYGMIAYQGIMWTVEVKRILKGYGP